jgi:hypothetical protein
MRKNEMNALTYAQITTWICLSLTTTFAWSLTERRALLFDAVCLFALAWGILLPFYSSRPTSWSVDLPVFSCFMLLLFGTQLRHAASIQRTGKQPDAPALIQKTGLSIVAIIALRLSIPHMEFLSEATQQSLRPYLYPGLNSILFVSAYILIWYGVTDFFKGGPNFNLVRSIVGFVALNAPRVVLGRDASLTALYSYPPAISGTDDHQSYFKVSGTYDLVKDDVHNYKFSLTAQYEKGGLNLTKENVDTFTLGLGILY